MFKQKITNFKLFKDHNQPTTTSWIDYLGMLELSNAVKRGHWELTKFDQPRVDRFYPSWRKMHDDCVVFEAEKANKIKEKKQK